MAPAVTLIRVAAPRVHAATYVAVPSEHALEVVAVGASVLADIATADPDDGLDPADFDVDTLPWETLPGVRRLAAAVFTGSGKRYALIGTTVDGQWTSWYPPCPQPPRPAQAPG